MLPVVKRTALKEIQLRKNKVNIVVCDHPLQKNFFLVVICLTIPERLLSNVYTVIIKLFPMVFSSVFTDCLNEGRVNGIIRLFL